MKKRYISTVALVILIVFFLAFIGVNYTKHYYLTKDITGRVTIVAGDCPCADGTAPGQCSINAPGRMCIETDNNVCALLYACEVCNECPSDAPYCTPGIGASGLGVCSSNAPRTCGDGICSSNESCSGCPQDCQDKRANCGDNFICDGGECVIGSSCGNSICELSLGETCSNCYQDCQGLKANCGTEEICLYSDANGFKSECVPSCGKNIACGCFFQECPRSGETYAFEEILFNYYEITGHNPEGYIYDINWNCLELNDPPVQDAHQTAWMECQYYSVTKGFMEIVESDTPNYCNDGTPERQCSLTQPLRCVNDKLTNDCSICGCSNGYYCGPKGEVCLINQSYVELVEKSPSIDGDEEDETKFALWRQLQNTYGINDGGPAVSGTILRKFAEGEDKGILKSPGTLITEVVKAKDVGSILKLSDEVIETTDDKIKESSAILESGNSEEIEQLLFNGEDSLIGGGLVGGVIANAAVIANQTNETPELSPYPGDIQIIDIPCVNESSSSTDVRGNCLGQVECCEGLVCSGGICISNKDVEPVPINVTLIDGEQEIEDDYGFSNLVNVRGDTGGVSVVEYETHPTEIKNLEIPNAVTFGFYDIKAENEVGASLSFEVLNDLLVTNQIMAVGLYRLTDDGWQSLDLEEITFNVDRTRFTFNTQGFSYFTLMGVKEGINFASVTQQDASLWSVYRRSFTPGFSLIEFFIGQQDTIIFGIFNGAPLIDLGLSGFS